MVTRERIHQLVDELLECDLPTAERVLRALRDTADPLLAFLESVPEDDEPETPEEVEAVAEAWAAVRRGDVVEQDEIDREFGQ